MDQFLNVFMLCLIFAHAKSEECSGIKLGKTGCVPQENSLTITSLPRESPLPINVALEKLRVTEIDISSSTMTVIMGLDLFWKDDR